MRRPKFDRYFPAESRETYIAWVMARFEFVEIEERIHVCRDPNDDKFLELAVAGQADIIISGDDDLLVLHPFRRIPILRPDKFLQAQIE